MTKNCTLHHVREEQHLTTTPLFLRVKLKLFSVADFVKAEKRRWEGGEKVNRE
jgi:hypothetical protein